MSEARTKPSGRRATALASALVVVAVATTAWVVAHRSSPEPQYAPDSGISVRKSASIPPEPLVPADVYLTIAGVTDASARIFLDDRSNGSQADSVVATGDTLQLGDAVVRVCATWKNRAFVPPWDMSVGGGDDKVYYVYSTDGSLPECPQRLA